MGETSGKGEKSGMWEYKNGDILNSFYRLPIVWQKKTRISPFSSTGTTQTRSPGDVRWGSR